MYMGDIDSQAAWERSYPEPPPRPDPSELPPWAQIHPEDLASFLPHSGIPLASIRSILDLGSGGGIRIIHAIARNPELNRRDLHVTCVDFAMPAVMWGVDLWRRVRSGMPVPELRLSEPVIPCWSMAFLDENVHALPLEIFERKFDLVIDWMLLHGMHPERAKRHARVIERLAPKYFMLKSFSKEGSTKEFLSEAVGGVVKAQRSRQEVEELFGPRFQLLGEPRPCAEDLEAQHSDGHVAAKMEYCFRLVGDVA